MRIRVAVIFATLAGVLILAPGAQASGGCPGKLPAKLNVPSAEVDEFERRAYVRVRPRGTKPLRAVRVRVAFRGVTLARGSADGKVTGPENVALEFFEPLEAERGYDVVVSANLRGCGSDRESLSRPVTFFDAGGGGGGGGGNLPGPGANVQGLTVDWSGGNWQGNDTSEVNLPGIGRGLVVCNPETEWLRVIPDDPGREVAILAYTYRRWEDSDEEGSVQEASTNRFGGVEFNLGFNKFGPTPEHRSRGTLTGVISDRLGFGAAGGAGAPPTMVELSWEWDFRDPGSSRCRVQANFTTEAPGSDAPFARSLIVNWRGDGAAAGNGAWTAEVPGLGSARVDCQAGVAGVRRFTLFPEPGVGPARFVAYEGSEVRESTQAQGPYRYELPNNGLVTADFGGTAAPELILSSRWKANDPDASQNFCFLGGVLTSPR